MKQALGCTQHKFCRSARYIKDGKLDSYCLLTYDERNSLLYIARFQLCTGHSGTCEYSSICAVDLHLYACKNTIIFILISHLSPGYFNNKYQLALERVSGVQFPIGTAFVSISLQHASCPLFHTVSCTMVSTVIFLLK